MNVLLMFNFEDLVDLRRFGKQLKVKTDHFIFFVNNITVHLFLHLVFLTNNAYVIL